MQEISGNPSAFTGRSFRNWLVELRNSHSLIKSSRSALIDRLLEGYDSARHGTGVGKEAVMSTREADDGGNLTAFPLGCVHQVFGEAEFQEYQQALDELVDV